MATWHWHIALAGFGLVGAALATQPPIPTAPSPTASAVRLDVASDRHTVMAHRSEERFVTITLTPQGDVATPTRRPVTLAVVMDVSGSMASAGKMDQARRAAHALTDALAPDDQLALISFNGAARLVHPLAGPASAGALHDAIDRMSIGGGTNIHAGIAEGVRQLDLPRGDAGRRVILLSDGQTNTGITDPAAIEGLAQAAQARGIGLSTVGLGLDFHEDLLARLSDVGGGSYAFVDQNSDLTAVFRDELNRSARIVGEHARVDLSFPPEVTPLEVLGWEHAVVDGAWRVPVGDLYLDERRKIVVRVRVQAGTTDNLTLVQANASWQHPEGDAGHAFADAAVAVTEMAQVAEASQDEAATRTAWRAQSMMMLDASSRAYADGDVAEAKRTLAEGQAYLERLKDKGFDDDATREDVAAFEAQAATYDVAAPTSAKGKHAIKKAKEQARVGAKH